MDGIGGIGEVNGMDGIGEMDGIGGIDGMNAIGGIDGVNGMDGIDDIDGIDRREAAPCSAAPGPIHGAPCSRQLPSPIPGRRRRRRSRGAALLPPSPRSLRFQREPLWRAGRAQGSGRSHQLEPGHGTFPISLQGQPLGASQPVPPYCCAPGICFKPKHFPLVEGSDLISVAPSSAAAGFHAAFQVWRCCQ